MKLLILVLSSKTYPSYRNEKIQKKTWAKNNSIDKRILFYRSGDQVSLKKDQLTVKAGKKTSDIGYKTMEAFDWCFKNIDFDYLLRTNTSSYIDIKNLESHIELFKNEKYLYNGMQMSLPRNEIRESVKFISGAGILMNRNTIKLLLDKKSDFEINEWDDVAIGKLLQENNIKTTPGKRFDVEGNVFAQPIDIENYHFRCRIDNHYGYPRFLEKYVLLEVHKRMSGSFKKSNNKLLNFVFKISKFFYIQSPFWKIYIFFNKLLKLVIPNIIYKKIKELFSSIDQKIKLRYMKK
tara:strand:- start:109 stop:987 length:879 start_codon:yes stop_codon:yes gene_type:complete